jgi:hypothetical protein
VEDVGGNKPGGAGPRTEGVEGLDCTPLLNVLEEEDAEGPVGMRGFAANEDPAVAVVPAAVG